MQSPLQLGYLETPLLHRRRAQQVLIPFRLAARASLERSLELNQLHREIAFLGKSLAALLAVSQHSRDLQVCLAVNQHRRARQACLAVNQHSRARQACLEASRHSRARQVCLAVSQNSRARQACLEASLHSRARQACSGANRHSRACQDCLEASRRSRAQQDCSGPNPRNRARRACLAAPSQTMLSVSPAHWAQVCHITRLLHLHPRLGQCQHQMQDSVRRSTCSLSGSARAGIRPTSAHVSSRYTCTTVHPMPKASSSCASAAPTPLG